MRLLRIIGTFLGIVADFLYAPVIRYYMREVAIRTPHFPGQRWWLPLLGEVVITGVTDYHVNYKVTAEEDGETYVCSRRDFGIHAKLQEDIEPNDNVINLSLIHNKERE